MPWRKTSPMSERAKFLVEWERRWQAGRGRVDVAELCRQYGVSRQTGYVWIQRYQDAGGDLRAAAERSRRPHTNPRATPLDVQDLIVRTRKAYPKWGPIKLRRLLVERRPHLRIPSASGIAVILRRRGMAAARPRHRRRRLPIEIAPPFPECTVPNDVWCMDFKGWFRTHDREKCFPFTLLDGLSRMLLRCEALLAPTGDAVRTILDSAFREYGLPRRLRSDGGPPFFAAPSPATLSTVSVWLLRLGITLECIAPAQPQQNGRLERFHRTLKREVDVGGDLREQQRRFDAFRGRYNCERPHAALELATPASVYRHSRQRYPRPLLTSDRGLHCERADRYGTIAWPRRRIFIGEAFAYEHLDLWPTDGERWDVYFGHIPIGVIDAAHGRFVPRRRSKGAMRLSYHGDPS
jgi:transposase InsO family protein